MNMNNINTSNNTLARYVCRLRGLPWSAREEEIRDFFSEEELKEVQIVYLTDGRASGEALVEFKNVISFQTAFLKNRQHIGHRYIEIFKSTGIEIDTAAGRAIRPPARPPKSQYVIRMRGLPYSATDEDVIDFFDIPRPSGIHLIKDDLGRPSGEGFVEFDTEVDAIAAMAKHRHHMGHRYIELFRSSPDELMRALGLTTGWFNSRNGTAQPKSTCILMRGLPYSCTESDITKFFQEIDVTPIRIHRKADGAEAYVEFYSISDTDKAMTRHRNYIGRRYIELFRVTYEDMARTVGLPVANTNIPATILSPSLATPSTNMQQTNNPHHPHHPNTATATTMNGAMINGALTPLNTTATAIMHTPLFSAQQTGATSHYQHPSYGQHHTTHQYQTPHGHAPHSYPNTNQAQHYNSAHAAHSYHAHSATPSTTATPSTHAASSHLLLSAANINALMNPLSIYNHAAQQQTANGVNNNNNNNNGNVNNGSTTTTQSQQQQQSSSSGGNSNNGNNNNNNNGAATGGTYPSYANYNQQSHKGNPYLVMNHGNQSGPHYQQRQSQQYYQPQYY